MIKGEQQELWKQRREDHEFRVNLSYVRHCITAEETMVKSSRKVLRMSKPACIPQAQAQ